jgi:hypothetical protein
VLNARVVDEDVEPTMFGKCRCDHPGDRVRARHIRRRIADLDAGLARDPRLRRGNVGSRAKPVQHHRRSGVRQRASDAEPDTAGGPGHDRNLAGQRPRRHVLRLYLDVHDGSLCD